MSALAALAAAAALAWPPPFVWPHATPTIVPGATAAGVGDVDVDGFGDLLVGDPSADDGRGVATIYGGGDPTVAPRVLWSSVGPAPGARWGAFVAGLGDVDGDGRPDWLVGSPAAALAEPGAGRVEVSFDLLPPTAAAHQRWVLEGASAAAPLVAAAAAGDVGDVDGDGHHHAGLVLADALGVVSLYRWPLDPSPAWSDRGPGALESFGAAGDLDADGRGEVFVGRAMQAVTVHGTAAGVAPPTGSRYVGDVDGDTVPDAVPPPPGALAVRPAGDLDGDGRADVVALTASAALLVRGTAEGLAVDPAATLPGAWRDAGPAGDLDGDGFGDVWLAGDDGRVVVIRGKGTLLARDGGVSIHSGAPPSPATLGLAPAGDFDGDGLADLVVADPNAQGVASRCRGEACVLRLDGEVLGSATQPPGDHFERVAGVGDVDGDGRADVVVAAPRASRDGLTECGAARLVPRDRNDKLVQWVGAAPGDHLGASVAGIGDLDGDGYADLALGAPRLDGGYVFVVRGSPDGPQDAVRIDFAAPAGAELGWLGPGADLDRDGFDDLAVGAPGVAAIYLLWGDASGPALANGGNRVARLVAKSPLPGYRFGASLTPTGLVAFADSEAAGAGAPGPAPIPLAIGASGLAMATLDAADDGQPGASWSGGGLVVPHRLRDGVPVALPSAELDPTRGGLAYALAPAGDVDGDGQPELVAGGPLTDDAPFTVVGAAADVGRVVLWSVSPLPEPGIVWEALGDAEHHQLGRDVAGVGDVDGDGFADVAVSYLDPAGGPTVALYRGNGGFGGKAAFASLIGPWRDASAEARPVPPGGLTTSRTELVFRARGRTPFGPMRVRLEVEVKPWDAPFDGRDLATSDWTFSGAAPDGVPLTVPVTGLTPGRGWRWRGRVAYDPSQASLDPAGHWFVGGRIGEPSTIHFRTAPNAAPVARDDGLPGEGGEVDPHYVVVTHGSTIVPAPGLIANDTDADGDALTVSTTLVEQPRHGHVEIGESGTFSYVSDGTPGLDAFRYQVSDPFGATAMATVHLDVRREDCEATSAAACARGDFFVVLTDAAGDLHGAHCFVKDTGEPDCDRNPDATVRLGSPVCELP